MKRLVVVLGVLGACASDPTAPPDAPAAEEVGRGTSRPYEHRVPAGHDPEREAPLVVLLHGRGGSGAWQMAYLGLGRVADEEGFLVAYPDGVPDAVGLRSWNATDGCCDLFGAGVDDVAYLRQVIDDMTARFRVDRVYLIGHSNGAFMAYRLACELGERIAGVAGIAGATWLDPARCPAPAPVSVLHIHGTLDAIIGYEGGRVPLAASPYPSARATVAQWAGLNGCDPTPSPRGRLNIDAVIWGEETEASGYEGCAGGSDVELWTVSLGGHVPVFARDAMGRVFRWLDRERRP